MNTELKNPLSFALKSFFKQLKLKKLNKKILYYQLIKQKSLSVKNPTQMMAK